MQIIVAYFIRQAWRYVTTKQPHVHEPIMTHYFKWIVLIHISFVPSATTLKWQLLFNSNLTPMVHHSVHYVTACNEASLILFGHLLATLLEPYQIVAQSSNWAPWFNLIAKHTRLINSATSNSIAQAVYSFHSLYALQTWEIVYYAKRKIICSKLTPHFNPIGILHSTVQDHLGIFSPQSFRSAQRHTAEVSSCIIHRRFRFSKNTKP